MTILYKNNSQIFLTKNVKLEKKVGTEQFSKGEMFNKHDSGHPVDHWINLFPSPIHHDPKWNTIRAARGKSTQTFKKSIFHFLFQIRKFITFATNVQMAFT